MENKPISINIYVVVSALALAILMTAAITFAVASAGNSQVTAEPEQSDTIEGVAFEQDLSQVDETDLQNHADTVEVDSSTELSAEEIEDLLYMREEEKLAHDVYTTLYQKWGLNIFSNISNSEQTHTDSIASLISSYGLEDPALNEIGEFSNLDLANLYEILVEQGSESVEAALNVGALIEDLDIVDLENAMARTEESAILTVYENLQRGSRNHLRSFTSMLSRYGESYTPQYLSESEYLEIISGALERGSANGGGGSGNGRGRQGNR